MGKPLMAIDLLRDLWKSTSMKSPKSRQTSRLNRPMVRLVTWKELRIIERTMNRQIKRNAHRRLASIEVVDRGVPLAVNRQVNQV